MKCFTQGQRPAGSFAGHAAWAGGLVLSLGASCAALAQDRAVMDASQIIGNRELPKVIYIVPWKKPAGAELPGQPPASVLDDVLAPLDRAVFRRQIQYLAAQAQLSAAAPMPPAPQASQATSAAPAAPAASAP